ncbi:MAG: hypothetical protein A2Y33_09370 [Spirochaetes bacterium GWF1_51_8]|nr:MAG: hypothetical protein A2Y33_09370 [Spirochaetes bacterium GWF1_51_8]
MDDGKKFTVFRHVVIRPGKNAPEPQAVFVVRFRPKKMSVRANIRFSLLPMMIFMGFSGFRSKYWAVDYETGLCQGLYEWQTAADAENYSRSVAMRFMAKRSDPVSVEWRIVEKGKDKKSLFELKDK